MESIIYDIAYFVGVIGFILGLQKLGQPSTARRGNLLAAGGMGLAILAALFSPLEGSSGNYIWIIISLAIGAAIGYSASNKVQMTDMPQLVSLFNGLGGACAVLITIVQLLMVDPASMGSMELITLLLTLFIGCVAFTGSMVAWAKLDGRLRDNSLSPPFPNIFNMIVLLLCLGCMAWVMSQEGYTLIGVGSLLLLASLYGITFVAPIGGADMPVVISLLNSFTGLTAALAGLIYNNQLMLMGGILVGSSGIILTIMMCKAMNRSLSHVLMGSFNTSSSSGNTDGTEDNRKAKELPKTDAAILLRYSKSVIIVPGYGLAVAQAQRLCKELDNELSAGGVEVSYAIHPVAGRMPGHMNVLLAEVDIPYEKLKDLDQANELFPNTDIVIVVGANDVVNPSAREDTSSPIYGMPILNVDEAANVLVLKRSMKPGYAGVQNP
ncbi:MAG: NAD(P)(+) transhydrogenase (Re/Si-specific) subunit beta, partial [Bacteroidota bacterium]